VTFPLPVVQAPRLRQSSIYDLRSCPRKFLLRHRCNLKRKGYSYSRALTVGTFFHEYMAVLHRGLTVQAADAVVADYITTHCAEAFEAGKDPELVRLDLVSADALARALAELHWEFFPIDTSRFQVLEVEQVVRNEWAEGIPDLCFLDKQRDEIWLDDHKTEGQDGLVRAAPLLFELQPRLYRLLLQEKLGRPVVGCVHNIIVKPAIEFCDKDRPWEMQPRTLTRKCKAGEKGDVVMEKVYTSDVPEYSLYLKRVRDYILAEGDYALERDNRQVNPMLLQSWVRFAGNPYSDVELMAEIQEARRKAGHFTNAEGDPALGANWMIEYPRHDQSCRAHRKLCEFADICTQAPELWPGTVSDKYEQRKEDIRYANG